MCIAAAASILLNAQSSFSYKRDPISFREQVVLLTHLICHSSYSLVQPKKLKQKSTAWDLA